MPDTSPIELDYTRPVWERQSKENTAAHGAFLAYMLMKTPRSVLRLVKEKGYKHGTLTVWARKYRWTERAAAYDDHVHNTTLEKQENLITDFQTQVIRDEVNDYRLLRTTWEGHLNRLLTAGENMSLEDFSKALKTMAQTRAVLDTLGRKSARLPAAYRSDVVSREEEPSAFPTDTIQISMRGPQFVTSLPAKGGERGEDHTSLDNS